MLKNKRLYHLVATFGLLGLVGQSYAAGLRSFIALPVDKGGTVIRVGVERASNSQVDSLLTGLAYGISAKQTLLLGMPYRLSPTGDNRQGDVSVLIRQIIKQNDFHSGTGRLGVLGGAIVPTDKNRDAAVQGGFVYTRFQGRHEVDIDALYQSGTGKRPNAGRYDVSWQYRLSPAERPDWGIAKELNSVLELNGRWKQGANTVHQATAGLQWIDQKWVLEGGITQDLNQAGTNKKELRYLLSARFHF